MSISMREFGRSTEGLIASVHGMPPGPDQVFAKLKNTIQSYFYAPLSPLTAACVLRDCSRRLQSSEAERHACRSLMRQAAINWRRCLTSGT
jgi:hypothetical protein